MTDSLVGAGWRSVKDPLAAARINLSLARRQVTCRRPGEVAQSKTRAPLARLDLSRFDCCHLPHIAVKMETTEGTFTRLWAPPPPQHLIWCAFSSWINEDRQLSFCDFRNAQQHWPVAVETSLRWLRPSVIFRCAMYFSRWKGEHLMPFSARGQMYWAEIKPPGENKAAALGRSGIVILIWGLKGFWSGFGLNDLPAAGGIDTRPPRALAPLVRVVLPWRLHDGRWLTAAEARLIPVTFHSPREPAHVARRRK